MAHPEVVRGRPGAETNPDAVLLPKRCALMPLSTSVPAHLDFRLSKSAASPPCSTKPRSTRHQTLIVPRAHCPSPISSMYNSPLNRLPSAEAVASTISREIPDVSIESITPLPPARPQRDISIRATNGKLFVLTLPPPQMLRLMRSEQWLVLSEALVIRWICKRAPEHSTRDKRISISYLIETEPHPTDYSPAAERDAGRLHKPDKSLLGYLPALLAHSPSSAALGTAFNLTEPPGGSTIASLQPPLSSADRAAVEYEKGQLIRRISGLEAPNSKFGPAISVIAPQTLSPSDHDTGTAASGLGGVDSWPEAFLALMEGTLRDGEDLAVTISYSMIRHHMRRLSHLLQAVTHPRLVVLDAGSDANVLVSQPPGLKEEAQTVKATRVKKEMVETGQGRDDAGSREHVDTTPIKEEELEEGISKSIHYRPSRSPSFTVKGLRDWSNCIFGDPLMTSVFSEDPSPELLRGFRQQPPSFPTTAVDSTAANNLRMSSPPPDDLIEDRENASIRLLLYEMYHATVCLVKQFYRPTRVDGTRTEMAARRRLAAALNKLAEVDENATKRPRTASVDIWPLKKPKSET